MIFFVSGLAVMAVTAVTFWNCLPRNGRLARFVDTVWEPYVGVVFTAGAVLGFSMAVSGVVEMLG